MSKILVTGGSGFIGTNLVKMLLDLGHSVLNIDKISYCSNKFLTKKFKGVAKYSFKKIDICNHALIQNALLSFKPNYIFHLAAETHVDNSIKNYDIFFKTNLNGTLNLLKSVQNLKKQTNCLKKIIHVGTDEIYGDLPLNSKKQLNEDSQILPNNPYSASKAAGVLAMYAWYKNFNIPIVISNCVNNFGEFQYPEKFIPRAILTSLTNKNIQVYGKGFNVRSWIYVKDHVNALVELMLKGKVGELYNISTNKKLKNIELAFKLKKVLKKLSINTNIVYVKDRLGHDLQYSISSSKIKKLKINIKSNFDINLNNTIEWYMNRNNLNYFSNLKKNIKRKGI